MNRRNLLKLALGAAVAAVLSRIPVAEAQARVASGTQGPVVFSNTHTDFFQTQIPTLWADGVNDDSPALNALIRGRGILPAHEYVSQFLRVDRNMLHIKGGRFAIKDTIDLTRAVPGLSIRIERNHFVPLPGCREMFILDEGVIFGTP